MSARVLIVEDEPSVRAGLVLAFESEGWHVTAVESGEGAVDGGFGEFDLVVVDKNLPGMSGVDLIRAVREVDDRVAIIMLTAYPTAGSATKSLNLGVDSYIEKPVRDVYRLTAKGREVLRRRERRRKRQGAPLTLRLGRAGGDAGRAKNSLRLVVACDPERRQRFADALPTRRLDIAVTHRGSESDAWASQVTPDTCDGVFLDCDSQIGDVVALVTQLREASPTTPCFAFGRGLDIDSVLALIDLNVLALLPELEDPEFADSLGRLLRRLVSEL